MNELINYEAVCKTAPATPGLLNISMLCFTVELVHGSNYFINFKISSCYDAFIVFYDIPGMSLFFYLYFNII